MTDDECQCWTSKWLTQDDVTGKWYFCDPAENVYGPYETKEAARAALIQWAYDHEHK